MGEAPKVSVIIPVYNKRNMLATCLDSMTNQTLRDIEIVCVDDCSTDGSASILADYAAKDERIKVVKHATNQGVGSARNTGIQNATGDYLVFVDADDTMVFDALEKLYKVCAQSNADICFYGITLERPSINHQRPDLFSLNKTLIPIKAGTEFTCDEVGCNAFIFTGASVCAKMFRRSYLDEVGLRFSEHAFAEDLLFSYTAMADAKSVVYADEYPYLYNLEASSGGLVKPGTIHVLIDVLKTLTTRIKSFGTFDKYREAMLIMSIMHLNNIIVQSPTETDLHTVFDAITEWINGDGQDLFSSPNPTFTEKYYEKLYGVLKQGSYPAFLAFRYESIFESLQLERQRGDTAEGNLLHAQNDIREANARVEEVRRSHSYRIGNAILRVPAKVRDIVRGKRNGEKRGAIETTQEPEESKSIFDWRKHYEMGNNPALNNVVSSLSNEQRKLADDGYKVFTEAFIDPDPSAFISYDNFASKHFGNPWLLDDPCVIEHADDGTPISMIWFMRMPLIVGDGEIYAAHGADYGSTQEGRGLPAIKTLIDGRTTLGKQGVPFRFGAPADHAAKVASKIGYERVGEFHEYALSFSGSSSAINELHKHALDALSQAPDNHALSIEAYENIPFTENDYELMNASDGSIKVKRSSDYYNWRIGLLENRDIAYVKATRDEKFAGYIVAEFTPSAIRIVDWDVFGSNSQKTESLAEMISACISLCSNDASLVFITHINNMQNEGELFKNLGFEQLYRDDGTPNINKLFIMPSAETTLDKELFDFSKWKLREIDRDYFMNCNPS